MITVDTNVLVRVLVDDPGEMVQVRQARAYVRQAEIVFVPRVVQAETVWVLRSGYRLRKEQVIFLLEHLAANQAYHLEDEQQFNEALLLYKTGKADFADYLILTAARARSSKVVTFDRRFSATADVVHLKGSA